MKNNIDYIYHPSYNKISLTHVILINRQTLTFTHTVTHSPISFMLLNLQLICMPCMTI